MTSAQARTGMPKGTMSKGEGRDLHVMEVSKLYDGCPAVDQVSFTLKEGQFLSLLGPSGSGKTSTLLMVAGFERPTSGDIRVADRSVVDDPPQRRNLGVGFQSYALFPHMSVLQNVEFPLTMRRMPRRERRRKALDILEKVGLTGLENRRPRQLSGGQQQRVSLARALVFEPAALLLDEPLGALDKRLRDQMQHEIKRLHVRTGVSVLYVTHDQEEAMAMSDLIAVMDEGRIVQLGTPDAVYHRPETVFVAHFLGETNLLKCSQRSQSGDYAQVTYSNGQRGLARGSDAPTEGFNASDRILCVRPERMDFLSPTQNRENELDVVVVESTFLGSHTRYVVDGLGQRIILRQGEEPGSARASAGARRRIGWNRDDAQLLAPEERGTRSLPTQIGPLAEH